MPFLFLHWLGIGLYCLSSAIPPAEAKKLVKHDVSFVPDIVLRVTIDTTSLNCQLRNSTLINGQYPAPPVYLKPEQTTWIRVYNDADVNTTIHWHGLSLSAAPWADGAPQASQWPIPPGCYFDYELYPSASDAGTSFYHSHVGFQASTAVGPLIVEDSDPLPYYYDDEIILQIGDFYPETDSFMEALLTNAPSFWPGDPSALLINGHSGLSPYASAQNEVDPSCEPWTMNVVAGKTYRVRVIGTTALSLVLFGIVDHHELTIIETDNSYVYPVDASYIQVDTGQRFSFLLTTKEQSEIQQASGRSKYWIQFTTREGESSINTYAVLNYLDIDSRQGTNADGDCDYPTEIDFSCPDGPPSTPVIDFSADHVTDWLEYRFQTYPMPGYEAPINASEVTRQIIISTGQFNTSSGLNLMQMDDQIWFDDPPLGPTNKTPFLIEILQNGTINDAVPDPSLASLNGGLDVSGTWVASIGEVLEIVWVNQASTPDGIWGPHPLHAHGGRYWDMGSGSGDWNPDFHAELLQANSINGEPYPGSRRDTTLLYKYALQGQPGELNGWRVWRIRVTEENVGVWMMHCHILQHIIMGQTTVWVFGTPQEINEYVWPVDESLDGYFTYGGSVVGKTGDEEEGLMVAFDE